MIARPRRERDRLVDTLREDFPALTQTVHGCRLVYLDNAATTQKPRVVIDAVARAYEAGAANVNRGAHYLGERATEAYEAARGKVQRFLGARRPEEVVFVRGTTEAINLVAASWGDLGPGDEIVVTEMEHHSNLVPWMNLAARTHASLVVAPVTDEGELDLRALDRLLGRRTRLVAVTHVSNVLGTVNPIAQICELAHQAGALVLVDGAQAIAHLPVDVRELGADFYCFSGHKLYGPAGIGVLWGRYELLAEMAPYQTGGGMITEVALPASGRVAGELATAGVTYKPPPERFEGGTPNVPGAVGLAAAIDWLGGQDRRAIAAHEAGLLDYAIERLSEVPGLTVLGSPAERVGAVSFVLATVHAHDVATILDSRGIAVRSGHHCAQPLMRRLGLPATSRASFALYNTIEEVDALVRGLRATKEVFA